ncbi:MAG: hypothetical protein FWB90_02185 [Fibromonadales bacterium]|nr:hypothetical protein [Fibromonadales bacterium]
MGLLFPNLSEENSKKVYVKHMLRVVIVLSVTALLTWYGKVYKPKPMLTTVNEFAVWIFPHQNGLSALAVLPNDNIDSNAVKTGLRIWISPPDSLLAFERHSAARYRGQNILAIGDSLSEQLREDMLSIIDSTGSLFWLGPLGKELVGEDVSAELKLFDGSLQDYVFDLTYEGNRLRFFGSQLALDSAAKEPASVSVIMFKKELFIWNGYGEESADFSSIDLDSPEAMALVSYSKATGLSAKRMRLREWEPSDKR